MSYKIAIASGKGGTGKTTLSVNIFMRLNKVFDGLVHLVDCDAPPGTSCSVVETIQDANFVILVTEPTIFGLHDLKLMVGLLSPSALSHSFWSNH